MLNILHFEVIKILNDLQLVFTIVLSTYFNIKKTPTHCWVSAFNYKT